MAEIRDHLRLVQRYPPQVSKIPGVVRASQETNFQVTLEPCHMLPSALGRHSSLVQNSEVHNIPVN